MKEIKSFSDAKQAVAEKHKWKPGGIEFMESQFPDLFGIINEAAELYMHHAVNEAARKDRSETSDEAYYDIYQDDHVVSVKVLSRPLPFPEEAL